MQYDTIEKLFWQRSISATEYSTIMLSEKAYTFDRPVKYRLTFYISSKYEFKWHEMQEAFWSFPIEVSDVTNDYKFVTKEGSQF